MNSQAAVLRPRVLSDQLARTRLADAMLVIAYAGFIGLSAQISVHLPFTPVPITGQTLAVLLGASVLGTSRALMGSGLYLVAGLIGVPWFAGGSGGVSVASSPTFGYIVGFIAASALVGYMASRDR
ncbi:MAG: biotin transporter BioY, partial [Actinomycetota bacterium]|nr:biotin transporter BioY [Actinomycetota bacterium]